MKALVKMILTASLAVALFGCAEEEAVRQDQLQLNFKINSDNNQLVSDLPSEATLVVSVETTGENPLYSLQNVPFSKSENGFTTSALDLQPGAYVLTELMLVDGEGKVLYTVPSADSPLNTAVRNPLGINFNVSANAASSVNSEMLNVSSHKPAEFGLATYNTRNSFQLMVMEEGAKQPVSAKATILKAGNPVATFDLPAKKSRIAFDGDLDETYTLVIQKDGFSAPTQEFSLGEWSRQYRNHPLKVTLAPAFTMVAKAGSDPEYPFYFYLGGSGSVSVNWGDGQTSTYSLDSESEVEMAHAYAAAGSYAVSVTGDLDKVDYFYSFYGGSIFSAINFTQLPNLNEVRFGLTSGPAVIDFSRNTKLQFAMLPGLLNLTELILPENNQIIFLEVDGSNLLDAADVEIIVANIYTNATNGNLRDGVLGLRASWAQDETDLTMLGPPSAVAMGKIVELRDKFGWIIHPTAPDDELITDGRIRLSRRDL